MELNEYADMTGTEFLKYFHFDDSEKAFQEGA